MKIVLLGATGQVGSLLVSAIKDRMPAAELLACSRKPGPGLFLFDPFRDDWHLPGQTDILINAIGAISATRSYSLAKTHIELARIISRNYTAAGSPRLIQVSALGAHPAHPAQFLRTKGIADEILLKIPGTVVLRPSIIFTPGTMIVRKISALLKISSLTGNIIPIPKSMTQTEIQTIAPDDFIDIVLEMIFHGEYNGILELAGPVAYSLPELIRKEAGIRGKKVTLMPINALLSDVLIGDLVPAILPGFISREQYRLLKENNVSHKQDAGKILGRPLKNIYR